MNNNHSQLERQEGCVLLAGPTASGKSALAMAIAEEFDGVVINADSMQVYQGLRVLTARPSIEDEKKLPHKLYGFLDPAELCTAASWRDAALNEIEAARVCGKLPIIVGGTGLYFDILTKGIAEIPAISTDVRNRLRGLQRDEGTDAIFKLLRQKDPAIAARLKEGDTQRLLRALEVFEETGISLLEWQAKAPTGPILGGERLWLALTPEREWVYERCNQRLDWMLEEGGALQEVATLKELSLDPSLPIMKALGVPELMSVLDGDVELEEAKDRIKMLTRRYAKRQMTWIRNKMCEANCFFAQDLESLKSYFFPIIRRFLLTQGK